MDIIYGILWLITAIVSVATLAVLMGWWRGVMDWDDIKKGAKAVKEFFWSSTPATASPTPTPGSGWNFHFGKAAIIVALGIIYIGTLALCFILGAVISRLYNPWAGWPVFIFLSAIFIAKNSKQIAVGKFARLLVWGFPTNICLGTGTYPLPFLGWLVDLEEFSTAEIPITLTIENIPNPDGTEVTVVLKGLLITDKDNITTFSELGGVAGVQANLMTRAEPCVKDWFQNTDHGPQTWQEAKQTGSAVVPIVLKTLLGDGQLPKIPSDIPTPALLRYFTKPRPAQTPAEEKQWGKSWENLVALLPTDPTELAKLMTALEVRKKAIASLSNGTAYFVDRATGTVFKTFGFDNITVQSGVADEAAKAAKELARGKAALAGVKDSIAQAKAVVTAIEEIFGTPLTPEQRVELFRKELEKVMVNLKMVSSDKAMMYIIPGLAELAPLIAQFLGGGTGNNSNQVADLATEVARLQAMIAAATAPAGTP